MDRVLESDIVQYLADCVFQGDHLFEVDGSWGWMKGDNCHWQPRFKCIDLYDLPCSDWDSPRYKDFDSEEQILLKDLLQKWVEILPRSLLRRDQFDLNRWYRT